MTFAIVLICTIIMCFILRNPIKKYPVLFYVLAVVIDMVFVAGIYFELPRPVWTASFLLIQKCTLSLALFVVVMYIGVFSKGAKITQWLRPIRAELSIIAWILSLGHVAVYLAAYIPRIFAGNGLDVNIIVSFIIAIVLLILLLLLGITSFDTIKRKIKTESWKRLQKLAYPFFMLVYVHLLFMLLPSALLGGGTAQVSIVIYSVIFIGYAALRIIRYILDRNTINVE